MKCKHQAGAFKDEKEWTHDYDSHDWKISWDSETSLLVCKNCDINFAKI